MRQIKPAPGLRIKYIIWVWIVFVCLLPLMLLSLAPEIPWLFAFIYLAANLLWAVPTSLLMLPYYDSISYELTDDEITVRKGILTKTEKRVPYHQITNVELKRGPLDRMLGIGTLEAQTAGYSQQAGAEAPLPGLADWEMVQREVMARVHKSRAALSEASRLKPDSAPEGEAAPSTTLLAEVLTELRAIREAVEARRR